MTESLYTNRQSLFDRGERQRLYFDSTEEYMDDVDVDTLAEELEVTIGINQHDGPEFYIDCKPEHAEELSTILRAKGLMTGMVVHRRFTLQDLANIDHLTLP